MENTFRTLAAISFLSLVTAVVVQVATDPFLAEPLQKFICDELAREHPQWSWFLLIVENVMLIVILAAYVGLFLWKSWGRSLFLWTGIITILWRPLFGLADVLTVWSSMIYSLDSVLYGAVIALAYFSEVRTKFEKTDLK